MIYECPQCGRPQEAGQTVCPYCRAEFDGPVPADAIVPAAAVVPAEAASEAPLAGEETVPEPLPPVSAAEAAPVNEDTAAEDGKDAPAAAPTGSAPYLTPPSYAPPPYTPPLSADTQSSYLPPNAPPLGRLTRVLLVAFPIVLVLVLGGVYLAGTLNTDSDSGPLPPPTVAAAAPMPPATVTNPAPVTLSGGTNTNDGADPHVKLLAGRWVSKSDDFYVFNSDGSGSHGSALNPSADQSFLWGLVQNRLMLYGTKNETMRFNVGPDSDTVFLAPQTGHYVQYSRAKS